jgi:hypothetical protein
MSWDITNDAAVFDGTEELWLLVIEGGEVAETVVVSGALRGTLQRGAAGSHTGLALVPEEVVFHLPAAALAGRTPRVGDALRDAAGREYSVLAAALASRGTRWVCRCTLARGAE